VRRKGGLRLAVTLLTVLPVPGAAPGEIEPAGEAMVWAPAVGLLLGGLAACVLLTGHYAGQLTGAALAVAALALLTRGLHLDGLADLADGLGSGKPAAGALEVMRRSDIGPMGVLTLVLTLFVQVAALAHGALSGRGTLAVITAVVTGRLAMTWACRRGVPAARPGGLGAMVAGTVRPVVPLVQTLAALTAATIIAALTWAGASWTLPAAIAAGLAAAFALERHAVRRLGGITGDVLGALAEVATTVALVVATLSH
jgi:adenosylcobinamide-GDP ribazoletransferase